jgi:hypothetical protein
LCSPRTAAGNQKGCRWTAGRDYQARNQDCWVRAAVNGLNALVTMFMPMPLSMNLAAYKSLSAGGAERLAAVVQRRLVEHEVVVVALGCDDPDHSCCPQS